MVGMLLVLIQQVGLYELSAFKDGETFLICSFIAQLIGGLGSGINAVASMAMVVSASKVEEREYNIGLIEMATGIGFLLGPIWGSVMYQLGGYSAPFGSTGKFVSTFLSSLKMVFMNSSLLRPLLSFLLHRFEECLGHPIVK